MRCGRSSATRKPTRRSNEALDIAFDEGEGFPAAYHDYLNLAYKLEHGIRAGKYFDALESVCNEFGDDNPDTANLPGMAEYRRAHPGPSLWERLRGFFRKMTAPRKSAAELIDADNPF
jgi:hypothetical protein